MTNNFLTTRFFLLSSLALSASGSCLAESVDNPDAHVHGEAQMSLVYEKGRLLMELESPMANFVGFEHKPESDTEWQKVKGLHKQLSSPEQLLVLPSSCKLVDAEVEVPFIESDDDHSEHDHEKEHHDHDDHDSKHQHDEKDMHEGHDEHEHHAHDDGDEKESKHDEHNHAHNDVSLSYEWNCKGSTPSSMKLNLFEQFSGFEKISVQSIIDGKQNLTTLNKSNFVLEM